MNKWVQATLGRELLRQVPRHSAVASMPVILLLGCLLTGMPLHVRGQVSTYYFSVNPVPGNATNVTAGIELSLAISYSTSVNFPLGDSIVFSPPPNPPTNWPGDATITSDGHFSWTPDPTLAGTSTNFTVWAYEAYHLTSNSVSFTVNVLTNGTPVATLPYLALPFTQTNITVGTTLTFTAFATNTDGSANALTFSLDPNAVAAGATITNNTPTNGVFTWTPTASQAGYLFTNTVIVTEANTSLSNSQSFVVNVGLTTDCAQLADFLAAVTNGGLVMLTNCPTIALTNTLTISNNVTLDAGTNNVTITGNNLLPLFTVLPDVSFTLKGVTLSGGQGTNFGGLYISSNAVVVLTNCTLVGNHAAGSNGVAGADGSTTGVNGGNGGNGTAGGRAFGGAIYNLGNLTALNCQFLTNSATGGSGGAGGGGGNGSGTLSRGGNGGNGGNGALAYGGAIFNEGSLWLSNCTFAGNSATGGSGGVAGTNGTATGTGALAGMPGTGGAGAAGSGAAVYSTNNAIIVNCTFAANLGQGGDSTAGGTDSAGNGISGAAGGNSLGGGVCNLSAGFLTNCTFSANQVAGGAGGAGGNGVGLIRSGGNGGNGGNGLGGCLYNAGKIVVVNCTFSGGSAVGGTNGLAGTGNSPGANNGSLGLGKGGDIAHGAGAFILQNSILATNSAGANAYDTSASRITDGGYNISSDASLNLSGTSLKNTDPQIGSLADNGGPTQTIALLGTNSPAIDRVRTSSFPATDQRGVQRPQGAACDVGAYEVAALPYLVVQPQSHTNAIGTPVTFTVSANGEPLGYQWAFNSVAIADATNASYTISSVDQTDAGNYDVVINNNSGSVTSSVIGLTVLVPPAITTPPSNQAAVVGSSVTFSVTATGTAPLIYQWTFQGTNLAGATAETLQLTNVQSSQVGSYAVMITNAAGSITSSIATLSVTFSPVISSIQPTNQSVPAGSAAAFTVSAAGAAPLAYQWRFNGTPIANATGSSYTLAKAQTTNGGTYTVVVTNVDGSITSAPVTLTVYALPHVAVQPDGSVQLAFAPALTCQVQASTNLGDWRALFTTNNVLSAGTFLLEFTDTNAANLPMRFYRVGQTLAGQPAFTNFFATNQSVSLDCVAAAILAYQIEASTNLTSWTTIFSSNLPAASPFQFQYSESNNLPLRFYRLSQSLGF